MYKVNRILSIIGILFLVLACRKYQSNFTYGDQDFLAGGSQTSFESGSGAFGEMYSGLNKEEVFLHELGDKAFESIFVSAPAPIHGGLGPIFNAVSCSSCHVADGRGKAPEEGEALQSLLIRLSLPGSDAHGGPLDVPGFGGQFQQRAISGTQSEGDAQILYTYIQGTYPDGSNYELRKPQIQLSSTISGELSTALTSARVAPPVFGLGLLEAIPVSRLLASEDPNDANNDGISGRVNWVWDLEKKKLMVGRFGWKANTPNLLQQSAAAYNQDMGITNYLFPMESSFGQEQYDGLDDDTEITDQTLYAVAFYMRSLKAPAPRNWKDPEVIQGKRLFDQFKCVACHTPMQQTDVNMAFVANSNQRFFPYTDLLLHDMGQGLSDQRPDFLASGNEWRTAPLWGIGLTEKVNGHSNFLHDGRARNIEEAILWHDGEAQWSRNLYMQAPIASRNALLRFLKSL
jgi:CxxC motif-containing protein (DUF1111 family)